MRIPSTADFFLACVPAIAALLAAPSIHAASQSWSGGSTANGNWSNVENWADNKPAPGSTTVANSPDVATFDAPIANGWGLAASPVVIDSPTQNIGGIKFINHPSTGNYFIGTKDGNALRLSSGGGIELAYHPAAATNHVNIATVNAPLVLQGSGHGFSNNSNYGILEIAGSITGVTGNTLLTLSGISASASTISGNIGNGTATSLGISIIGNSIWVLSGANTYSGDTSIGTGIVPSILRGEVTGTSLTPASPFGTGTIQMNSGTLGLLASGSLNSTPETITLGNNVALNFPALIEVNPPAGAGSRNKTIAMGNLTAKARTLRINQGGNYALSFSSVTLTGGPTFNPSNQLILGPVGEVEDSKNLTHAGPGILRLIDANTYSGLTTVNGGVLVLDHNLALQHSTLVTTGAGTVILGTGVTTPTLGGLSGATGNLATLVTSGYGSVTALTLNPGVNLYTGTPVTRTYGGIIANGSGNTTLTKTGAGTQVLTGANIYTGTTAVRAGTLRIDGNQTAATGAVTVGGSGSIATPTLAGTGTLGGQVTIAASGILAPGSPGIGTLVISKGSLTFGSGSTASFDVDADTIIHRDRVTGISALTYGGRLKITATTGSLTAGDTWDLFDFTSQSGTFENHSTFGTNGASDPDLPDLGPGLTWQFNYATGALSVAGNSAPGIFH